MFPKDSPQARTGARARAIVHYALDSYTWEYHEETGSDVGRDCFIELVEEGEYRNHKIECQIKGTENINRYRLKNGSFSLPVKTATLSYGLNSALPFVIFLVDNKTEDVMFMEIAEHFSSNRNQREKLEQQETLSIPFSLDKTLSNNGEDLVRIALRKQCLSPRCCESMTEQQKSCKTQ